MLEQGASDTKNTIILEVIRRHANHHRRAATSSTTSGNERVTDFEHTIPRTSFGDELSDERRQTAKRAMTNELPSLTPTPQAPQSMTSTVTSGDEFREKCRNDLVIKFSNQNTKGVHLGGRLQDERRRTPRQTATYESWNSLSNSYFLNLKSKPINIAA